MEPNQEDIDIAIQILNNINLEKASVKEIEDILTPIFVGHTVIAPLFNEGALIYRGRICDKPEFFWQITYPQKKFVTHYGRANDIGQSVFYGSIGKAAPLAEIRAKVGDYVCMSHWITTSKMMLNHVAFSSEVENIITSRRSLEEVYQFVVNSKNFSASSAYVYNFLASKFIIDVPDNENYKYKLSLAITNKLISDPFDGIMYPSLALFGNADNIILNPSYVDKNLKLVSIEYYKIKSIKDAMYEIEILDTATEISNDGKIVWSGRHLSWSVKNDAKFAVVNQEYIARETDETFIFPTCGGALINGLTSLAKLYQRQEGRIIKVTDEFTVTNKSGDILISKTLNFAIGTQFKHLSIYIPNCLNVNNLLEYLISNFSVISDFDVINHIEMNNSNGELEYTTDGKNIINKIEIYSENEVNEAKLTSKFDDFELIFFH